MLTNFTPPFANETSPLLYEVPNLGRSLGKLGWYDLQIRRDVYRHDATYELLISHK